jgi:hypothetical protein
MNWNVSLPRDGYDFRSDPEGRSLGEMAWYLAEAEAYGTFMIERGAFSHEVLDPFSEPNHQRERRSSLLVPRGALAVGDFLRESAQESAIGWLNPRLSALLPGEPKRHL